MAAQKDIKKNDFDLLMYLDDIVYFSKKHFKEGIYWGGWDFNKFERLMNKGMIEKVSGTGTGKGNPTRYKLTLKARRMVTSAYKMCYGEQPIPESEYLNPIMKGETYSHKKMRKFIINHNKQLKDERR